MNNYKEIRKSSLRLPKADVTQAPGHDFENIATAVVANVFRNHVLVWDAAGSKEDAEQGTDAIIGARNSGLPVDWSLFVDGKASKSHRFDLLYTPNWIVEETNRWKLYCHRGQQLELVESGATFIEMGIRYDNNVVTFARPVLVVGFSDLLGSEESPILSKKQYYEVRPQLIKYWSSICGRLLLEGAKLYKQHVVA